MKSILLNPLAIFFLFFSASILWKKTGQVARWVTVLFLYLASSPVSTQLLIPFWSLPDSPNSIQTLDYILPLGGTTDYKWYLMRERSGMTPFRSYYRLNENAHRVISALDAMEKSQSLKLLLIEDKAETFNEANLLANFATAQGIDESRIRKLGEATNTKEEADRAHRFVTSEPGALLIITSESHMRRALHTFQKAGLNPHALSSGRISRKITPDSFIPSTTGLRLTQDLLYEVSGYTYYWIKGWL